MQTSNTLQRIGTAVLTMPEELRKFVITQAPNPSPYNKETSGSFYDCTDKSWNYTPDGSIRVSDHWNFYSRGQIHCQTDICDERIAGKWVVAKYSAETGLYHVISVDERDTTAMEKRHQRWVRDRFSQTENEIREKRLERARQIRREKEAAIRAKKIRNGAKRLKGPRIWVEVNVNKWSGTGRRVRFAGTETLFGYLTWESKTGRSFSIRTTSGFEREIRKYNSYKEFKRKPRK